MRLRLNFKYLIIIILVIGLLSGCIYGKKEDDIEDIKSNYMSSINNDIRDHEIKKFIKGDLNFKKLDIEEKNNDMVLYNFHLEVNFQEDLLDIPDNDVAKVLTIFDFPDLINFKEKKIGSNSYGNVKTITYRNKSNEYIIELGDTYQIYKNNEVLEPEAPFSYKKSKSPYTEKELQEDSRAPSNNPDDYNSEGEYVPSEGPSNNPEDYNSEGEYKPTEGMTQEEIKEELNKMFD